MNNCIGGKNYGKFIRLLLTVFVYCLVFIGQGVWIFVRSYLDGLENGGIRSRWAVLVIFLAIGVGVVLVALLLGFHLYLAFCRRMSTY